MEDKNNKKLMRERSAWNEVCEAFEKSDRSVRACMIQKGPSCRCEKFEEKFYFL